MRADRLLSLVLLLRHRGRMSAAELARELEVSTRTVLRDVDALSAAGVPVYAERGRTGGFALLPGYRTDLTGLTHDEARALLVAGSRSAPAAMGPALASAMRKVVAALPDAQRDVATAAAGRVLLRPDGMLHEKQAPAPGSAERLAAVQRAVFAGQRLRVRYAAKGEPARWRTIDPVGLVDAGGQWYLLATHDGAERTYRLSRMVEVAETGEPADRPGEVDLEQLWERRRAGFRAALPALAVTVRVRAERRAALLRAAVVEAETDGGDGWVVLHLRTGGLGHAEHLLWALGPDAEALDPPALRAALAGRAAATARRYPDVDPGPARPS